MRISKKASVDAQASHTIDPGQTQSAVTLGDRALAALAVASAVSVANGYYIQPLLVDIGSAFSIPSHLLGFLPALSQFGLACGVVFLLPLGDVVSTRNLLMAIVPLQIAALMMICLSGQSGILAAACLLVGVFGITPYVLAPYASLHAPPGRIGQVTGVLTRGGIIGILLARAVAGVVGTHFGWRAVYGIAAATMLGVLFALRSLVRPAPPVAQAEKGVRYSDLLRSLVHLVRTIPALRTAALCQAFNFGSFNVFWLGSTLYLRSPQFGWTAEEVGLVAIVGAVAASAAPLFGRVADSKGPRATRRAALGCMSVAWLSLVVFRHYLAGMAVGLVLLDIGSTVCDISNRTILYSLEPEVRTRLNAIYMSAMFGGAALMSVLVGICWSPGGWIGICMLGLTSLVCALILTRGVDDA
jgi:predicted MFS family arabinose efflux permease